MLELQGTHGTSLTRALKIIETQNPRLSSAGRLGCGFYLWRYDEYAYSLAIAWCIQNKDKGVFSNDEHPECRVILVDLRVDRGQILALDEDVVQDRTIKLLKKRPGLKKRSPADFFEFLISLFEQERGSEFAMLRGRVSPPARKYNEGYPFLVLGQPICYVVRNMNIITKIQMLESPS